MKIELITVINAPVERCFNLARSIDLHKESTTGTREEAVAGVTSGLIGDQQEVTWRATHFGIRQTLTSRITAFRYPHYFRDEMIKGAFRMIRHDHLFEVSGEKTVMKDIFTFESPGGLLGVCFSKLILQKYLRRLLNKRNLVIKQVAEGNDWRRFLDHEH